MAQLDARSKILLKTLVERYIAEGQPVGSRALSRYSGLELSPATVRNVMSDLEEMGYIASPHTSAGRIPTPLGYRLFVDSLLTVQPLESLQMQAVSGQLRDQLQPDQPQRLISSASHLLSELTHFAGVVVVSPRKDAVRIRQIEFISLSETRILLIIVTTAGDVQNRMLITRRPYSASELAATANYLNQNFSGLDFGEIKLRVQAELAQLRSDMTELMAAAVEAGSEAVDETAAYVVSGETNLLEVEDLASNMARLRELFKLFEQKTGLMQLLDVSNRAQGVQLFIGGESGLEPLDTCSVVAAPYEVNGVVVGSVGVIGPTRMAYERVIPIVDITARLLSSALSNQP